MADDFKTKLKKAYTEDVYWNKILVMLAGDDTTRRRSRSTETPSSEISEEDDTGNGSEDVKHGVRFKHRNGFIYYTSGDGRERLCIPQSMEQEVFKIAHDLPRLLRSTLCAHHRHRTT